MNTPTSLRRIWAAGALGALVSATANLALYALARGPLGIELLVPAGPGSGQLVLLEPSKTMIASMAPAVVAALVFAGLSLWTRRPLRNLLALAAPLFALSIVGPLQLPMDLAPRLVLAAMHAVAACSIVGAFLVVAGNRARAPSAGGLVPDPGH